jgi:SAM-dependent MidA family methyltransferase
MAIPLDDSSDRLILSKLIKQKIASSPCDRITFAEFMDLALYHPQYGYYATNRAKIGTEGDFFTAPHLGAAFGELLAEQFVQMWEIMQQPNSFTLVEIGAGQGLLASDILRYLQRKYPQFYQALDYVIVERAATLIAEQQWQLRDLKETGISLHWKTWDQIPSDSIAGCFFSNELIDALPIHQVVIESGQLREIYVANSQSDRDSISFIEAVGELSTPQLSAYFDLINIRLPSRQYPDGYRSEINLAALDWMQTVADRLRQGYVLTIDYGYTGDRYYNPARSQGTLQCYYRHAHHSDPYKNVGQQDITAHVNFTALERQGECCGLQTIGFTHQGLFLMALGIGERIAAVSQSTTTNSNEIQKLLQQRQALHLLIDPLGLGNFGVLIQGKQVNTQVLLHGLQGELLG